MTAEITSGSTISDQAAVSSYLSSSFNAGLSVLTLTPSTACSTANGYTLFSSTGVLALGSPLALEVNGASTTVTVYACCGALTGATQLSCGATLQRLTVNVQTLMSSETLALSNASTNVRGVRYSYSSDTDY